MSVTAILTGFFILPSGATLALPTDPSSVARAIQTSSHGAMVELLVELNSTLRFSSTERTEFLELMEKRPDVGDSKMRALIEAFRCRLLLDRGAFEEARRSCDKALEWAKQSENDAALYAAHRQRAGLAAELDETARGVEHYMRALDHAERRGDRSGAVVVYSSLAYIAQSASVFDEAARFLELAMERTRSVDEPDLRALLANNLASVLLLSGDLDEAQSVYREALALAERLRPGTLAFTIRAGAALTRARLGDVEAALAVMTDLLARAEDDVPVIWHGIGHQFVAEMRLALGDHQGARTEIRRALVMIGQAELRKTEARLLEVEVERAVGHLERSLALADALTESESLSARDLHRAWLEKARTLEALDRRGEAERAKEKSATYKAEFTENASKYRLPLVGARYHASALARDLEAAEDRAALQLRIRNAAALAALVIAVLLLVVLVQHRRQRRLQAERERQFRLETVGRLTGGVAHDFNNLLAVIRQALDLLSLEESLTQDGRECVAEATDATMAGARIVQQLVAFSRSGTMSMSEVELPDFFSKVDHLLRRTAGEAISVRIDCDCRTKVRADADLLTAVLVNLVANARDAMSGSGTVVLSTRQVGDRRVAISLVDDGEGMSSEARKRAFEPFFTTKHPEQGSGLGLSMVHGWVRSWGGETRLESGVGRGTKVTLLLRTR